MKLELNTHYLCDNSQGYMKDTGWMTEISDQWNNMKMTSMRFFMKFESSFYFQIVLMFKTLLK